MRSRYEEREAERKNGPRYNVNSVTLGKFRFAARKGLMALPRETRVAYANAVEAAVLASQRSHQRVVIEPQPMCASGTWHNTGEAIHKALRAKQKAALAACPGQERRARKPQQWLAMYEAAMRERRLRETSPELRAAEQAELERLKSKYAVAA